jgi:hypothetical protein
MANHTSHGIIGSLDSQAAMDAIERILPAHQQQRRLLESPMCHKGFCTHTQAARLRVSSASAVSFIHTPATHDHNAENDAPIEQMEANNMVADNVAHRVAANVPPEAQHALDFRFNGVPANLEGRYFATHLGAIIEGHFKDWIRDVRDNTNVQILLMAQNPCSTWFRLCADDHIDTASTAIQAKVRTRLQHHTLRTVIRSLFGIHPAEINGTNWTHTPDPMAHRILNLPHTNQYPATPSVQ